MIILSHVIPVVVLQFQKAGGSKAMYRRREWAGNELLQLHKTALEKGEIGPWEVDEDVPVLVHGKQIFIPAWLLGASLASDHGSSHQRHLKGYGVGRDCDGRSESAMELLDMRAEEESGRAFG